VTSHKAILAAAVADFDGSADGQNAASRFLDRVDALKAKH
jgi:hypothetical protein